MTPRENLQVAFPATFVVTADFSLPRFAGTTRRLRPGETIRVCGNQVKTLYTEREAEGLLLATYTRADFLLAARMQSAPPKGVLCAFPFPGIPVEQVVHAALAAGNSPCQHCTDAGSCAWRRKSGSQRLYLAHGEGALKEWIL